MDDFKKSLLKGSLKQYAQAHLRPSRNDPRKFVCPCCGSGDSSRRDSDSAFSITDDGLHFKCFSCGAFGDVFDLAGAVLGTDDRRAQLEEVARFAGVELDGARAPMQQTARPAASEEDPAGLERASAYVDRCTRAMAQGCAGWGYMLGRGFLPEEIAAFGIGWDAEDGRVVVPYPGAGGYYVARKAADGCAKNERYRKPKGVAEPLFLTGEIAKDCTLFVVEGQLDALAIAAAGGVAAALGTSSGASRVAAALKSVDRFEGVAVVALDADDAGRAGSKKAASELMAAGVRAVEADVSEAVPGAKDAADALRDGREALRRWVEAQAWAAKQAAGERYFDRLRALGHAPSCEELERLWELDDLTPPVPTGFAMLDAELDGGLRPGLAVLGALSSMGKTTFALQVADSIAAGGRPVLFASIEQTARELIAKSLSRMMRERGVVKSERSVCDPKRKAWTGEPAAAFSGAWEAYRAVAEWLVFLEGSRCAEGLGVAQIEEAAGLITARCDCPPVVFVDYLQLLKAPDDAPNERKAVDMNVTRLRQLANRLRTPVVVVSSINRQSYESPIDLDSFKESGGIEYGADLVLGIQPRGLGNAYSQAMGEGTDARARAKVADMVHRCKEASERRVEVRVLKQRGGRGEAAVPFTFLPVSSAFFAGEVAPAPGAYASRSLQDAAGAQIGDGPAQEGRDGVTGAQARPEGA